MEVSIFAGVESGVESGVQRFYAAPADSPPTTKHLKYLSNHQVFLHQNPTQESPLQALSNESSFVRFHETVLEIAFTHNISPTAQDLGATKDSLDARRKDLKDEP